MIALTLREIAEATGSAVSGCDDPDAVVVDGVVTTDSRECGPGSLYVARRGEFADGHDYAPAAAAAGAVAVLGERPVDGVPTVVSADVQSAFGRLARAVIDRAQDLKVVGITGSSGKTTVKDMLATVLSTAGETVSPVNSLNGEIGVPLTVCRVTPTTRFLVAEMGARGIGHIDYLTAIAPPQVAIVLNVGTAHVGEFGSVENIAHAKSELPRALPESGLAILNADDAAVLRMRDGLAARVVTVGESPDADLRASDVRLDERGRASYTLNGFGESRHISLAQSGRHHVGNSLAVVAAARELGLDLPAIVAALATAGPVSRWRMEITDRPDGVTIVNDAYNANPDSMRAAIEALGAMRASGRRWAVLGGMLELGETSNEQHRAVGARAREGGIDRLVCVGELARDIARGWNERAAPSGAVALADEVADTDAAYELVTSGIGPGDVVLLKSSRDSGLRWLGDRLAGIGGATGTNNATGAGSTTSSDVLGSGSEVGA